MVRGYLTVFVTLSLTVLLSLFLAVLESVRQSTVSVEAEIIANTGLNSVLAEYHRELFKQYNLFFLDTSYGSDSASIGEVEKHLAYYVSENCAVRPENIGSLLYRDFLCMEAGDMRVLKAAVATDFEGGIFRERAIEAIEDDVGITYLKDIADWFGIVMQNEWGEEDLVQEKNAVDEEIASYNGCSKKVGEDWVQVEVKNPTEPLEVQTGKGILHLVLEDLENLSAAGVDNSGLVSARKKREGINQGDWADASSETGLYDRILFHEYIMHYCGNFREPLTKGVLRYQVEYLIGGKNNDVDNLKSVVYKLSGLREASNLIFLLTDSVKSAQAGEAALLAASAVLLPEIAPILKTAIMLGWAYAESLYDVKCLLAGKRVPLFKTEESWHYDISCVLEGILEEGSDPVEEDVKNGLDYAEYLRILLLLSSLETNTFRLMDIVEMDIRQTKGNQNFRIDACVDRLKVQIHILSAYGYSAKVERALSY